MSIIAILIAATFAAENPSPIDFDTEIVPILTKAGCNAGACHGSAAGRSGFKLSLYGSDAAVDYEAIVYQLEGRRINLAAPQESLVLLKPTGSLNHGGGFRLDPEEAGAAKMLAWIEAGAQRLKQRQLKHLKVTPASRVVNRLKSNVSLRAIAQFSDGSTEDVTAWTVFTPEDPAAVKVDSKTAAAQLLRRGRHIIIARYLDRVIPIQLIVPLSAEPVDLSAEPRQNFIDEFIYKTLSTLRLPVSPPADDATFLRRVRLGLTGTLPSPAEVKAFLASKNNQKRTQLIGRLMKTGEFTDYWTYQFAKLLRIRSQPQDTRGARTYYKWLRQQIESGAPYDRMAKQLLTATGDSHQVGPANFYRTVGGAREQAEFVSELFLGVRLRCANCHNHPLDRWTQDDYHGLAAVFAKLQRGRVIKVGSSGEVTHPKTGEAAIPRIPGERFLPTKGDGRVALAGWLTQPTNPFFARALVNRLWKSLMGRGLVEPADDLRATNPATHPALLDRLAADFVQNGYNIRHTLRLIAMSAAYGRSAKTIAANRADDRFYSHALVRPLEPEVLADALTEVSGVPDRYGDEPIGTRAIALFDSKIKSDALDILGRCSREQSCESPTNSVGGLSRKLHLMNGPLVNRKVTEPDSRLQTLLAAEQTAADIVTEFYLRGLGRLPTKEEAGYWDRQFAATNNPDEKRRLAEDFVWSLLTCREFVTNH